MGGLPLGLSGALMAVLLVTLFVAQFPRLVIATGSDANDLTVFNAATSPHGLRVALIWLLPGLLLILTCMWFVQRAFRGEAELDHGGVY